MHIVSYKQIHIHTNVGLFIHECALMFVFLRHYCTKMQLLFRESKLGLNWAQNTNNNYLRHTEKACLQFEVHVGYQWMISDAGC